MKVLVSVALCTYNAEKFLSEQIDSILCQTLQPTEIVICDDGSTDKTIDILNVYLFNYSTLFKIYKNENKLGYIKNFEKCISLCNNNLIAISDHDDIWKEDKLEKLTHTIGESFLVYSNSLFIDENGASLNKTLTSQYSFFSNPHPNSFIFSNCVWGHTCLFKKELLTYAFPIPENAPYDIWLGFIAANTGGISYVNEVLTYWRQHNSSFSTSHLKPEKSKQEQSLKDYNKQLQWMQTLLLSKHYKDVIFLEKLIKLYKQKTKGFSILLLYFLLSHKKVLFAFWRKNQLSLINECRKLSRKV